MGETLHGQKKIWLLIQKLNEGDAGEIWLAQDNESKGEYIVKRPSRRTYGSDVFRQARQIAQEGEILYQLQAQRISVTVAGATLRPVWIYDDGGLADGGSKVFIVLEKAKGFDFQYLTRLQSSRVRDNTAEQGKASQFIRMFAGLDTFPPLLIYRMIAGVAQLLQKVHHTPLDVSGKTYSGVGWNDVKLDHIFWDPFSHQFTIIDWGNAQLLGADGISLNRQFSLKNDHLQFCSKIKNFLEQVHLAHTFHRTLSNCDEQNFYQLTSEARRLAEQEYRQLEQLRTREKQIDSGNIAELRRIQQEIVSYGEAPDDTIWQRYWEREITSAIDKFDATQYRRALGKLKRTSLNESEKVTELLLKIGQGLTNDDDRKRIRDALTHVKHNRWAKAFWELSKLPNNADCNIDIDADRCRIQRLLRSLAGISVAETPVQILQRISENKPPETREQIKSIIDKWRKAEPRPSTRWLNYEDEKDRLPELLSTSEWQTFQRSLNILEAINNSVADAWKHKDFTLVRQLLPEWLLRDPDRNRIHTLARYVDDKRSYSVHAWLQKFQEGPRKKCKKDEDFIKLLDEGKKYQITSTRDCPWLSDRIQFLEEWEKGTPITHLAQEEKFADLIAETPWINKCLRNVQVQQRKAFYVALQKGDYDQCTRIADRYPGGDYLRNLAIAFRNLDRAIKNDGNSVLPERSLPNIQPPSADKQYPRAKDLYRQIWQLCFGQQQGSDFQQITKKTYAEWAIVKAVKPQIETYKEWKKAAHTNTLIKNDWRLPPSNNLPDDFQNFISAFRQIFGVIQRYDQTGSLERIQDNTFQEEWKRATNKFLDAEKRFSTWMERASSCAEKWLKTAQGAQIKKRGERIKNQIEIITQHQGYNDDQHQKAWREINNALGIRVSRRETTRKPRPKGPSCASTIMWTIATLVIGCLIATVLITRSGIRTLSQWLSPNPAAVATMAPTDVVHTNGFTPTADAVSGIPGEPLLPTPSLTASPTPSPTPDLTVKCQDLSRWGHEMQWERVQAELSSLDKDQYRELRDACGWDYTYKQMKLEVGLLTLPPQDANPTSSSFATTRLRNLLRDLYPGAEAILWSHTFDESISWLKTTLALCHLPGSLTKTQRDVLQAYLPQHIEFDKAAEIVEQICGNPVSAETVAQIPPAESEELSFINLPGWPQPQILNSGCAFQSQESIRWKMNLTTPQCPIPPEVTGRPTWRETSALQAGFCTVPEGTTGTFPLTFWLQRFGETAGVQIDMQDQALRNIRVLPDAADIPIFYNNASEVRLACRSAYKPQLVLHPVWVGRLLFWQVQVRDPDTKEMVPLPLPAPQTWPEIIFTSGDDAMLEFFWELDPHWTPDEHSPAKVHLYIETLNYERRR